MIEGRFHVRFYLVLKFVTQPRQCEYLYLSPLSLHLNISCELPVFQVLGFFSSSSIMFKLRAERICDMVWYNETHPSTSEPIDLRRRCYRRKGLRVSRSTFFPSPACSAYRRGFFGSMCRGLLFSKIMNSRSVGSDTLLVSTIRDRVLHCDIWLSHSIPTCYY